MKKCGVCGQMNADGNQFCAKCGSRLGAPQSVGKRCIYCGYELESAAKFCKKCGKPQTMPNQQMKPPQPPKKKNHTVLIVVILAVLLAILALGGTGYYLYTNELLFFAEKEDDAADDKRSKVEKDEDESAENHADDKKETKKPKKSAKPKETDAPQTPSQTQAADVDRTKPIKLSAQVRVSSELAGGTYGANNLTDANADTAWAEGVPGAGIGEYAVYKLSGSQMVYGVAILPGDVGSSLAVNSYPTKISVTAGKFKETLNVGGIQYNYNDTNLGYAMLYLDFKQPVKAEEIVITIEETYMGQQDVACISELYLYSYPEKGNDSVYSANAWNVSHNPMTGDYILPDSSVRYLAKEELAGLTAEQCRIARNEIYARHGRIFDDETLQAYFSSFSWYHGTIPAANFNDDALNEFEKANRDLIVQFETEQGYR